MSVELGEPRIFIVVERDVTDAAISQVTRTYRWIDLHTWLQAKHPGAVAEASINECLAELGYKP